jgi:transposase
LNEEKKQQVIALGRLGWSMRRIQRTTGVRRETAAAYLKAAGVPLRPPGGWGRHDPKPAIGVITGSVAAKTALDAGTIPVSSKPANEVTTDFGVELEANKAGTVEPQPGRSPSASACEAYRDAIELGLSRGRNAMAIWQDLVDASGFAAGYQSVRRFVWKLQGSRSPEACAVIETAPGEESQVDYGEGPTVRDPQSGKYRRTRLFVLTLGYSRKSVRLLVFRSSSQIWAELHEKAFLRLGGATKVVVLDNLREGVLTADIYERSGIFRAHAPRGRGAEGAARCVRMITILRKFHRHASAARSIRGNRPKKDLSRNSTRSMRSVRLPRPSSRASGA